MDSFIKLFMINVVDQDATIGLLSDYPFTGFEEDQNDLIGYMARIDWTDKIQIEILELLEPFASNVQIEEIPFENWNHKWEEYYPEVEIDHFCRIYAPFHSNSLHKFNYEVLISPQMAFGTGHHATTEMMIRLMSHISKRIRNSTVLDFGAGSGILAILAAKMDAAHVDAIEIDPYAYQNLEENILLNHANRVRAYMGGREMVPVSTSYDIILANVTRNIILDHTHVFFEWLKHGGRILLSGIHERDHSDIILAYKKAGFYELESMKIGKWAAVLLGK